jgi:hypothetical protein
LLLIAEIRPPVSVFHLLVCFRCSVVVANNAMQGRVEKVSKLITGSTSTEKNAVKLGVRINDGTGLLDLTLWRLSTSLLLSFDHCLKTSLPLSTAHCNKASWCSWKALGSCRRMLPGLTLLACIDSVQV